MMPSAPIHPGEILKDEMEALNLSSAELARAINVPANRTRNTPSSRPKPWPRSATPPLKYWSSNELCRIAQ
jgi:hypothetical protein